MNGLTILILIIVVIITALLFKKRTEHFHDCEKDWSINKGKGKICITPVDFENTLTIMSTQKQAIVIGNNHVLLDGGGSGLNFLVFTRQSVLNLDQVVSFSINCCVDEINKMINFLRSIKGDEIIIIVSKAIPFKLLLRHTDLFTQFVVEMKKFGMTKWNFTEDSNYIFIGTKKGDLLFEKISEKTAYYPDYEIIQHYCQKNPANIYPPSEYIFFNELVPYEETVTRCLLEASARNADSFGIVEGRICIPLTKDNMTSMLSMPRDSDCLNGEGAKGSMDIYQFNKVTSHFDMMTNKTEGVYFYQLPYYTGVMKYLLQGEHITNVEVRSLVVPEDFIVYFVHKNAIVYDIYGPKKLTNFNPPTFDKVVVSRHYQNNVVLCNGLRGGICVSLGPGSHLLPPYFFLKYKTVKMSPVTRKVELYAGASLDNLIDEITTYDGEPDLNVVPFPKYIRSIRIL